MVGCRKGWRRKECCKKVGPMFRSNSEGFALCLGLVVLYSPCFDRFEVFRYEI